MKIVSEFPTATIKTIAATKSLVKPGLSRRSLLSWLGVAWAAFTAATATMSVATVRYMYPNVLFEPSQTFEAGFPDELQAGEVDERFKQSERVWLVRDATGIYALLSYLESVARPVSPGVDCLRLSKRGALRINAVESTIAGVGQAPVSRNNVEHISDHDPYLSKCRPGCFQPAIPLDASNRSWSLSISCYDILTIHREVPERNGDWILSLRSCVDASHREPCAMAYRAAYSDRMAQLRPHTGNPPCWMHSVWEIDSLIFPASSRREGAFQLATRRSPYSCFKMVFPWTSTLHAKKDRHEQDQEDTLRS